VHQLANKNITNNLSDLSKTNSIHNNNAIVYFSAVFAQIHSKMCRVLNKEVVINFNSKLSLVTTWKGKYWRTDNTKNRIRKRKLKNEELSG
jgi:hypothetical protein